MVELEVAARAAPLAGGRNERAASAIANPDGAADVRGDTATMGSGRGPFLGALAFDLRREFALLALGDHGFNCPPIDRGDIPRRNRMAQQSLRVAEAFLVL